MSHGQTVARRPNIELKGNEGVSRANMDVGIPGPAAGAKAPSQAGSCVEIGRSSRQAGRDGAGSTGSERLAAPGGLRTQEAPALF